MNECVFKGFHFMKNVLTNGLSNSNVLTRQLNENNLYTGLWQNLLQIFLKSTGGCKLSVNVQQFFWITEY